MCMCVYQGNILHISCLIICFPVVLTCSICKVRKEYKPWTLNCSEINLDMCVYHYIYRYICVCVSLYRYIYGREGVTFIYNLCEIHEPMHVCFLISTNCKKAMLTYQLIFWYSECTKCTGAQGAIWYPNIINSINQITKSRKDKNNNTSTKVSFHNSIFFSGRIAYRRRFYHVKKYSDIESYVNPLQYHAVI